MTQILCHVNLFADSSILLTKENSTELIGSVPFAELAPILHRACLEYGVTHIHLFGSDVILKEMSKEIEHYAQNYSQNSITVEVN